VTVAAPSLITLRVAAALSALSATAVVIQLAARERTPPVRCPEGLSLERGRCCGFGQTRPRERCEGPARACGPRQELVARVGEPAGCVLEADRVPLAAGELPAGAADWQLALPAEPVRVAAFAIDRGEVTRARYAECVAATVCPPAPGSAEPGMPVSGVTPDVAERFCRFAGGRLPSSAEWRYAASGAEGRRFPWGFMGLVCRRAAFGLVTGPCSTEGSGPDLAGARPPGATPEGVLDLAGNVAEWTRDPNGHYRARGGSFRSRVAAELVTAAVEVARPDADHVGFRCVYERARITP
jgi:formylglycine-generating enzyme required for sulfatase activity